MENGGKFRAAKRIGIDISSAVFPPEHENIEFVQGNVISFTTDRRFDVIFSDNVIKHTALPELPSHLRNVKNIMIRGG